MMRQESGGKQAGRAQCTLIKCEEVQNVRAAYACSKVPQLAGYCCMDGSWRVGGESAPDAHHMCIACRLLLLHLFLQHGVPCQPWHWGLYAYEDTCIVKICSACIQCIAALPSACTWLSRMCKKAVLQACMLRTMTWQPHTELG